MRRALLLFAMLVGCTGRVDTSTPMNEPQATPSADPPSDPVPPAEPPSLIAKPIVIALGNVVSGSPMKFTIPPNAIAFNVAIRTSVFGQFVAVDRLVSPSGVAVVDARTPIGANHAITFGHNGVAAAESPQTDALGAMPVEVGEWTATFSAPEGAVASVVVQVTDDGQFHGGILDLDVYVPASFRFTDEEIDARLEAFFERTALHSAVYRGKVTKHTIHTEFVQLDTASKLARSVMETKAVPDGTQSLHVVLTEAIKLNGADIWGIATGLPGASTRTGSASSGVALAFLGTPEEDAHALEHEAGHFFGLSHTTELEGGLHDPLSDTPFCANTNDLASCPDRTSVMFPVLIEPPGSTAFSPAQATIFGTNPAVHAIARPMPLNRISAPKRDLTPPSERVRNMRCVSGTIRL
jgi:hypothetical protein